MPQTPAATLEPAPPAAQPHPPPPPPHLHAQRHALNKALAERVADIVARSHERAVLAEGLNDTHALKARQAVLVVRHLVSYLWGRRGCGHGGVAGGVRTWLAGAAGRRLPFAPWPSLAPPGHTTGAIARRCGTRCQGCPWAVWQGRDVGAAAHGLHGGKPPA
jgi:hypothetical protein